MDDAPLILGTRGSLLARWQADHVRQALVDAGEDVEIREITTTGDRNLRTPLAQIGDKGLFTKELDLALLEGAIDLAVHSLKDLPTRLPEGLDIAVVSERVNPGDAFVAHPSFAGSLKELPEGATLATSSLRRRAQLLAWRPDLRVIPVRGNVDTRLQKLDESDWHGLVLAVAGLVRLGRGERIREVISKQIMLPAVSQGALGIVCREGDRVTIEKVRAVIHDPDTEAAVTAERALLRRLEGGCQVPIGAHGRVREGRLELEACVASLDGNQLVRDRIGGVVAESRRLGVELAERLLAMGGEEILTGVRDQAEG